jgi:Flp pilus assembly protein TadG
MASLRPLLNDRSGSAAAEMALLLPFLVLLMFGGVELGFYFYNQHQVVKGVRDGARFAARQSFTSLNCNGGTPSTIPADVETAIKEITRTGQVSGGTARVSGWVNGDIAVSVTCPTTPVTTGIYNGMANAPQVNVTATVSYASLFDGVGVVDSTYTLRASQQAAVMGI